MSPRDPSLVTIKEFAALVRVDPRTVKRAIAAGEVRTMRFRGVVRIATSEVERLTVTRGRAEGAR